MKTNFNQQFSLNFHVLVFQDNLHYNCFRQQGAVQWNPSEAECDTVRDMVPVYCDNFYLCNFNILKPQVSTILSSEPAGS